MSTEEIWDTFASRLRSFIVSKVKDELVADDIIQEVFLKVHLKKDDLKDESKFSSWLYSIARNSINDYFRSIKHFDEIEELAEDEDNELPAKDIRCMNTCLVPLTSSWSKQDQDIFNMTDVLRIPQVEVATQLNIPYSTLKSRVQKLRGELKAKLIECCQIELNERDEIVSVDCPKCG